MNILEFQRWWKIKKSRIYTSLLRRCAGGIGKRSVIHPPFHSNNLKQFFMGENSSVQRYGWIDCIHRYAKIDFEPRLEIGDGVYIGHFVHIIACGHMRIGNRVVIADKVYITDNFHGFENVDMPVMAQPLRHPGPVTIEDEVWIGEGVCIMPNVTIGKHSVIGSNSVVTKSVPPYSVAVGAPARVVKRYDIDKKMWEKAPETSWK